MIAPIWKGSQALTESPDSPVIEETGNEVTVTQTYSGPYEVCRSSKPAQGSRCAIYSKAAVRKTTVSKLPGGKGKLVVVSSVVENPGGSSAPLADPIPEVDWIRIEKPLAQHPQFINALTPQMIADAKKWAEDPSSYTGDSFGTGTKQALFATKLARGQDSYVVYAPVVKLTTEHNGRPITGNCGKISIPEYGAGAGLGNWVYLKTGDTARPEKGRWTRTQEWTGADAIDPDIYGPSSGLP